MTNIIGKYLQFGENGHHEHSYNFLKGKDNLRERIVQFSFQLTRTNEKGLAKLETVFHSLLRDLFSKWSKRELEEGEECETGKECDLTERNAYLVMLYKMIAWTRDIVDGKGECMLAYMMIFVWYPYHPASALFALKCFVTLNEDHPYGSWKDIKYFCHYCMSRGVVLESTLIQEAIRLANDQLRLDAEEGSHLSLVSRWIPREKSKKFGGDLYEAFACQYFSSYMETANANTMSASRMAAKLKCKTEYRKLLARLNREIDTVQIKQCGRTWCEISFDKVTSITLSKQKRAFLNVKTNGEPRFANNEDRIKCAQHFGEHIQRAVNGEIEMKGQRVSLQDFVKQAQELLSMKQRQRYISGASVKPSWEAEVNLLNSQWRDHSCQTGRLGNMIAIVDVSHSMSGDPMQVAIALGIRIAEKSLLGKRVLTFSEKPCWVNLDQAADDTFLSMVEMVSRAPWGQSTNFVAALDLILNAIVESKLPPEEVQNMVLTVLSDMQINESDPNYVRDDCMYDMIQRKYEATGMRLFGKPFRPPHILFWNLRSTDGFPTLSSQRNCSMMSGFSSALLNSFCEEGLEALLATTPWSHLEKILQNSRYNVMEENFLELVKEI